MSAPRSRCLWDLVGPDCQCLSRTAVRNACVHAIKPGDTVRHRPMNRSPGLILLFGHAPEVTYRWLSLSSSSPLYSEIGSGRLLRSGRRWKLAARVLNVQNASDVARSLASRPRGGMINIVFFGQASIQPVAKIAKIRYRNLERNLQVRDRLDKVSRAGVESCDRKVRGYSPVLLRQMRRTAYHRTGTLRLCSEMSEKRSLLMHSYWYNGWR